MLHGSVRESHGNERVISQVPHVSALMKPVLRLDYLPVPMYCLPRARSCGGTKGPVGGVPKVLRGT